MTDRISPAPNYQGGVRALLIATNSNQDAVITEAVAMARGRIVDRLAWSGDIRQLGENGGIDTIIVEAEGVDADRLAAALPRIDTLASAIGAQVVVALSEWQIDLVAAHLLGPRVQLLCVPTIAERVAALTIAGAAVSPTRLDDAATEAEMARVRRLNEEVARIAETLARLTRRDATSAAPEREAGMVGDRTLPYGAPPDAEPVTIEAQEIRNTIRARRMRDQFFERGLLEDPAWDMLLDLFAADLERSEVSVSSLCIAAAVAPTTALRWITRMSSAGLIVRHPDPFDKRRAFLALSEAARAGLQNYVSAVKRAGLPVV